MPTLSADLRKKMGNKIKECKYCFTTQNLTIDHKVPKSKGGTDDRSNLQYLCRRCNLHKGSMYDGQFRTLMSVVAQIILDRKKKRI